LDFYSAIFLFKSASNIQAVPSWSFLINSLDWKPVEVDDEEEEQVRDKENLVEEEEKTLWARSW